MEQSYLTSSLWGSLFQKMAVKIKACNRKPADRPEGVSSIELEKGRPSEEPKERT